MRKGGLGFSISNLLWVQKRGVWQWLFCAFLGVEFVYIVCVQIFNVNIRKTVSFEPPSNAVYVL